MTSKKPYFPNNWKKYKDAPEEVFQTLSFEEFHDWRVRSWDIPESVLCIIRVFNNKTCKVSEFVYKSGAHATKKLDKLMLDPHNEITICDEDEIHLIKHFDDDDPELL